MVTFLGRTGLEALKSVLCVLYFKILCDDGV